MSDSLRSQASQAPPPIWTVQDADKRPLTTGKDRSQRLEPGTIIAGKYHLGEPIGRGAWSTVYAATQQPIGRDVAMKIAGGATDDPVLRARFAREARFLAAIDHPNVVKVYEMGWLETGPAAIAMERMYGETLQQRLDRTGALPPRDAFHIVQQLLGAISEVHSRSIVHRDLKPTNVFLADRRGDIGARLLDFGIGRDLGDNDRLTAAGKFVGSPAYLAPEQMVPGGAVDARADLYTLGILLFQTLTGRLPFVAPGWRVIMMVINDPPPTPSELRPGLGTTVDALLAKALAKKPDERFQTADEMSEALRVASLMIDYESVLDPPQVTQGLRMDGIRKRFGAAVALDGVDLEVRPGEVHAIIGENGAGKSTLMRVLSGAVRPDAGTMRWRGEPFAPRDPRASLRAGIAMIHQELVLAPHLTVAQNLVLGREPHRFGVLRSSVRRAQVDGVLELLAHPDLEPDREVRTLSPGPKQLVEIGRALLGDARLVVLDEPTSSLSGAEVRSLDAVVTKLRARNVAIVYITHFLEELTRVADRVTVLRDGRTVASGLPASSDASALVLHMVGRPLGEIYPRVPRAPGEVVLELADLGGARLPRDATLALRRGEVLGIAGLVGAGRTELVRAVYGLESVRTGTVTVRGTVDRGRSVTERIAQGLGLLSEDRKGEGIALDRPIADNVTMSRELSRFGVLSMARREDAVEGWMTKLGVKARGPEQPAGELSGGNQQKLALARLLHQDADVLLLDEPTRGIDVGSKVEIYRRIGELAAGGKAILIVSSYLPELLGICDRIAVMHKGVLGSAREASEWTQASLFTHATRGARDESGAAA